jgi:1,4-alpha-glucan branching enzyme
MTDSNGPRHHAAGPPDPARPGATSPDPADRVASPDPDDRAASPDPDDRRRPSPRRTPADARSATPAPKSPSPHAPGTAGAPATPGAHAPADPSPEHPSAEAPAVSPDAPAEPSASDYEKLIGGDTRNPHAILGRHPQPDGSTVIRTLRHHAKAVTVLAGSDQIPMQHTYGGIFAVSVPGEIGDYRLRVDYGPDAVYEVDDPYRWLPTVGEMDQYLIGEGRHEQLWEVLGAHVRSYDTPGGAVTGTSFAVWAPNARGVRISGDFDHWTGAGTPMRMIGSSGVWELFVPGVGDGTRYKYQILGRDGVWRDKADPMAFCTEVPPANASVVATAEHAWADDEWMAERAENGWAARPMSIYEVHAGSWRQGLNYRQLADALVDYLADTGFTHVEFLPLAGHPYGGSWGYQVTSYYATDARFGTPDDFRHLVDTLHQHGYGVILDWVPAHFPRDAWALARFDGTPLYEHPDPRRGEQPDWGTLVFNFARAEVRNFLVANALFWLEEFHLDGLRVDAVASMLYLDYSRQPGQWLPNMYGGNENLDAVSFLQETNATVGKRVPGAVMIAEESTSWPGVTRPTHLGGLGFGLKWNMGWMHDTLSYVSRDPVHRSWHHNDMTFAMMYAYSEHFVLPLSHDEVVHGKGSLWGKVPGDPWRKAATLRAYFAYMWAHPGKQLLFMGGELGNPAEWSETGELPWQLADDPLHGGIKSLVGDLNRVYRGTAALYSQDFSPSGFTWIDANDRDGNVFAFLRWGDDGSALACIVNFSAVPHAGYQVGLPIAGPWDEVVNTDAALYGGSGVGNLGRVVADGGSRHGQPASATVTLPPLGAIWLVPAATS